MHGGRVPYLLHGVEFLAKDNRHQTGEKRVSERNLQKSFIENESMFENANNSYKWVFGRISIKY